MVGEVEGGRAVPRSKYKKYYRLEVLLDAQYFEDAQMIRWLRSRKNMSAEVRAAIWEYMSIHYPEAVSERHGRK